MSPSSPLPHQTCSPSPSGIPSCHWPLYCSPLSAQTYGIGALLKPGKSHKAQVPDLVWLRGKEGSPVTSHCAGSRPGGP
jgi:hypothetical protein